MVYHRDWLCYLCYAIRRLPVPPPTHTAIHTHNHTHTLQNNAPLHFLRRLVQIDLDCHESFGVMQLHQCWIRVGKAFGCFWPPWIWYAWGYRHIYRAVGKDSRQSEYYPQMCILIHRYIAAWSACNYHDNLIIQVETNLMQDNTLVEYLHVRQVVCNFINTLRNNNIIVCNISRQFYISLWAFHCNGVTVRRDNLRYRNIKHKNSTLATYDIPRPVSRPPGDDWSRWTPLALSGL